jgi:hypothetical protein
MTLRLDLRLAVARSSSVAAECDDDARAGH